MDLNDTLRILNANYAKATNGNFRRFLDINYIFSR